MDINNNQQINTFTKGMDTDTSDMYIGEGSYRYAENLRVVTDKDGNTGELHLIEGTNIVSEVHGPGVQLLGFTSIRNYIIEIVKRGSAWAICRRTVEKDELTGEYKVGEREVVAGQFTKPIWPTKEEEVDGETVVVDDWDGKTKPLSLVTRWEADDNIKLYIANGLTEVLSINIAKLNQGSNFELIFQYATTTLLPPTVTVTTAKGAVIPGVTMQYGYIIYQKGGAASTLSILSNAVVSAVNNVTGFAADENSNNLVTIELPEYVVGKYVRLYRICYSKSGLLPKVDIIYDQQCQLKTITDGGLSIQNISTAEFIATNKLLLAPKEMESKGDYLFVGNVTYKLDEIDELFSKFDARCFSAGSYYISGNNTINIGSEASNTLLEQVKTENIGHHQFDDPAVTYNAQYWLKNSQGYNGHGRCFNWKYVYNSSELSENNQYGTVNVPRTYARNEVYRFGVKLYDKDGRASSVKWIADIKMPNYFDPNGDDSMKPYILYRNGNQTIINNVSILFVPILSDLWDNVYKYEIVQAKRGIADSYKIMQGISGYPMQVGESTSNEICLPYYLTTQDFYVGRGLAASSSSWAGFNDDWTYLHNNPSFLYPQDKNQLLFISPEYVYQSDDVKALLEEYKTSLFHHTIGTFGQQDAISLVGVYTFNAIDALFGAGVTLKPMLCLSPGNNSITGDGDADLRIGVYPEGGTKQSGTYYLTSQLMNQCNYTRSAARYNPKGGSYEDHDRRKMAFFTNIKPKELLQLPAKNDISVQKVTFYDSADPEDVAKDEKCTVRSKFANLKNGKKFFNWTNPTILDEPLNWFFNGSGNDDDLNNSWKQLTMTAWNDWYIGLKYQWITDSTGSEWSRNRGRVGAQALSFPTSPGGKGIILETGNETSTYFDNVVYELGDQSQNFTTETVYSGEVVHPVIDRLDASANERYRYTWYGPNIDASSDQFSFDITFEDGTKATCPMSYGIPSRLTDSIAFIAQTTSGKRVDIRVQGTQSMISTTVCIGSKAADSTFVPSESPAEVDTNMIQCPISIVIKKQVNLGGESDGFYPMPPVTVANLYKSAVPYGGYNISAINSTLYIGEGYVQDKQNPIVVSMGDNRITMFAYMLYHNFDNAQHDTITSAALQYILPIESTMDLSKTCSNYIQTTHAADLPIPGDGVWLLAKPNTNAGRFTLTTDMYMYNTAYSVLPDIITYAGQDTVNTADSLYDSRIHYSLKKQNNELIDSWTSFKAIDYLDVDSRYGLVTGLKLFKDKLIFLQENGAGVLSVNDRIILKDQESANIIVGNGGVLDRYDYFTTIYGMKPDLHVVEATNDALYWWDGHRREILGYTDGYNIALLQRIKNVQNYINNGTESDTPSIICDANNKEVLFNVVNNESLVYNEQIQQFTSVYTFNPIYYCNIYGDIYLTEPWFNWSRLCKYNVDNTDGEGPKLGLNLIKPKLKYIVNKDPVYNKVFDVQTFGGRFYGGDDEDLVNLNFDYKTPLKQHSRAEHGEGITNREYDYRLAIPRNNDDLYGGRMRGKTMECEITSDSNNKDFSIQYVTTKYRMSWS